MGLEAAFAERLDDAAGGADVVHDDVGGVGATGAEFLGNEGDEGVRRDEGALGVDKADAVAVAVEEDADVSTLGLDGTAQLGAVVFLERVGAVAFEAARATGV